MGLSPYIEKNLHDPEQNDSNKNEINPRHNQFKLNTRGVHGLGWAGSCIF